MPTPSKSADERAPVPTNTQIAAALDELGDLYELDGAVIHRVVAYRNGAKAVREASRSVAELAAHGKATNLPGIGDTLQEKIQALTDTGQIPALEKLRAKFPPGLIELTALPGLGPKRARRLYEELQIDSPQALREAAESQRIRALKGFGPKAEEQLLAALDSYAASGVGTRTVLHRALPLLEELLAELRRHPACRRAEPAGSARRMAESVKDLDIVAASENPAALAAAAAGFPQVQSASTPGENAVRLLTHAGLHVDLRIVEPDQFGNALQHLTGSGKHNAALRNLAVRRSLHLSEYGVLDESTGANRRCPTEAEVYGLVGMAYIEPELREDRGELQAALATFAEDPEHAHLPQLVEVDDLRGDLHCHTHASDGTASIEEMALAAKDRGYEYLAITDHSASMGFGADVSAEQLWRQIELIHATEVDDLTLLAGSEVNILPNGSLDYPDELLAQLDWVIASVHTSFRMSEATMTQRLVRAIEHPYVDCIGHLTGRKIGSRPPYELNVDAVLDAAARTGTMLEINANPDRRDLSELHARAATEAGVGLVINCDAHRTAGFEVARYGVATARRAWLGPEQILNTQPWEQFAKLRKRAR